MMQKVNLYVDDDLKILMDQRQKEFGLPVSAQVRKALEMYFDADITMPGKQVAQAVESGSNNTIDRDDF